VYFWPSPPVFLYITAPLAVNVDDGQEVLPKLTHPATGSKENPGAATTKSFPPAVYPLSLLPLYIKLF